MLRNSGLEEPDFRYYANTELDSWPKLLATLAILSNEALDIRTTLERHNGQ